MANGSSPYLYNPPADGPTWLGWGATHQSDHFAIAQGIKIATGIVVPIYPVDPVPLHAERSQMLDWFMNHQVMHNAIVAALGIADYDLSYVDFQSAEQRSTWIQYNALFHQAAFAAIARLQAQKAAREAQPSLSQPIALQPQPNTQIAPQPEGNQAIAPQGNPGITTIEAQPTTPGVQAQGGLPQPAEQPFPTQQPQPSQSPPPGIQGGTPVPPGGG
jgi:hypothetical protein